MRSSVLGRKGMGVAISPLVALIIVLVVFIFFFILFARTNSVVRSTGDDGTCAIDVLEQSGRNEIVDSTQLTRFYSVFNYKINCDASAYYQTVKRLATVSQAIINKEIRDTADMDPLLQYTEADFDSEADKVKYNLDRFYADQLKDCMRKIGDREVFPSRYELSKVELQGKSGWWVHTKSWFKDVVGVEERYAPPVYCVLCAKVYYSEDVKALLGGENYRVTEYLLSHKDALQSDRTLYEYLDQGRYVNPDEQYNVDNLQRYEYDVEDTQGIIYFRRYDNPWTARDFISDAALLVGTAGTGAIYSTVAKVGVKGAVKLAALSTISRKAKLKAASAAAPYVGGVGVYSFGTTFVGRYTNDEGELLNVEGATKLFSDFDPGQKVPGEYGVAIVPYYEIANQCDFLGNSYGKLLG